ncbi:S1 RNA-binding domain-containing protein [Candidatus Saccharibacteria bacterium]|nr:S1 RNA-binding domain-containing protein [Candidatus Saccharibacteria bacterium]MCB9834930.1 S1 RNA-binding domain-containing protein [Candidatus Nomurabacteria bacterium]
MTTETKSKTETTTNTKATSMDDLLSATPLTILQEGDLIQGEVIKSLKHQIWLDLGVHGTGVITSNELEYTTVRPEIGEVISASVIEPETKYGYAVLSLKKVAKEKGWDRLTEKFENKEVFGVTPIDANKGGLIVEMEGVKGFLPVSQLSAENYPRVSGADKDEILSRLNKLIGRVLMVRIIDLDRKNNKLIISEKEAQKELTQSKLSKLKVGEVIRGIVTGIVDFGIFVNVDGIEGLVHISEISWKRIDSPNEHVRIGEEVDVKIISIDQDKLSLSIKQLTPDPWVEEASKLKVGEKVDGKIVRITPFGAFVQISEIIEALVHVSELSEEPIKDPRKILKLNEIKQFKILSIDPEQHKLSLSLK